MQKDYAKRTIKNSSPKKNKRTFEFIFLSVTILVIGFSYVLYKNKIALTQHFKNASANPTVSANRDIHFDFYNELPNVQSLVKTTEEKNNPLVKDEKKDLKNKFVLQIGAFKDEATANQSRVSLLLLGCESEITKIANKDGTFYQLNSIPYSTLAKAKRMQKRLQSQGIISSLKDN